MCSQQSATTTPTMRFLKLIALDPRVKGGFVSPARDHQDLILSVGSKNLHRDEAWELLNESLPVREPLDDVVGHPLLYRQPVNDGDHTQPLLRYGRKGQPRD